MATLSDRLNDVDIRLLRVFVAVAEHGGVTLAAAGLNVDPSTISRQLTELEERLDLRLCERGRAGFWLTEEGRVVRDRAQDLLGSLRDFHRHIREIHKQMEGEYVVAVADAYLWEPRLMLAPALRALKSEAPAIELTVEVLSPDEVVRRVYNRACHIGIMAVAHRRKNLVYTRLFEETLFLYCAPGHRFFGEEKPIRLSALRNEQIVTLPYDSGTATTIQALNLKPGAKTNSMEGVATFIKSGLFLGFLPDYFGAVFEEKGEMQRVRSREARCKLEVCALVHESEQHMKINALFTGRLKRNSSD